MSPDAIMWMVLLIAGLCLFGYLLGTRVTQVIPGGPVASQEAIKILGTNGGGYFNANSAHPFENPNVFISLHCARRSPCTCLGVGHRRHRVAVADRAVRNAL